MATQESDEVTEMYCEPCHKDGFDHTADGFCTTCVEYLCAVCIRYHRKHLPDHGLQDIDNMPQDFCLEPCPSHSAEIVKFYCEKCNKFACPHCKSELHSKCEGVLHLSKLSADFEKSTELKDLEKNIHMAKKELGSVKAIIKKGNEHSEMSRSNIIKAMKKQRDGMNLRYDHLETQINSKTLKIHNDNKTELQVQYNIADKVEKELTALQADIYNMKVSLQRCKLFIKSKNAENMVDSMREKLKQVKKEIVVQDYTYEPVEYAAYEREPGVIRTEGKIKATDITESLAYKQFGAKMTMQLIQELPRSQKFLLIIAVILLAVFDFKENLIYILLLTATTVFWFITKRELSFIPQRYDLMKRLLALCIRITKWTLKIFKYENFKDFKLFCNLQQWFKQLQSSYISAKTQHNVTCDITGLCFLSETHIVAVDNSNSSVKIIDVDQESVITELNIGGKLPFRNPWDVTKISNDQLAVTVPHSETICYLQLTCCFSSNLISLSLTQTILAGCICYGIVYTNNKLIITSTGPECAVIILDMDGNSLQIFKQDSVGGDLFRSPYYIAISPDNNSMYVSDYRLEQVTRLSMDGNVLAVFKHSDLKCLFGMTTDKTGKVYVCGWSNIYMLSDDLAEAQKLIDVERPLNNIAYCNRRNTFCLSSWENDNISRFKKANGI